MPYQPIAAPPSLQAYVQYFWILENDSSDTTPKIYRPVADGCPGLILQLGEKPTFTDQTCKALPELLVYGQTVKHREIHSNAPLRALGACFYPHALKAIFGLNADDLTDTCADIHALGRNPDRNLLEALRNAASVDEQVALLSSHLLGQRKQNQSKGDQRMQYALQRIIQSKGEVALGRLQKELQLSEKSFQRRFKQWVGIPPKLFARICRFQASLTQLRRNRYNKLSDIAFDHAYADQSHYIREFKEFAGFSPYQYQKQTHEILENFTELIR